MTNQDYMDLLKRFSTEESNISLKIDYDEDHNMIIRHTVLTEAYHFQSAKYNDPAPCNCNVIEISDGNLIMLMPNIMDAYISQNTSSSGIQELYKMNAVLMRDQGKIPNQISMSQIMIPYYEDEAERFQRELSGEFVLYETHLKYIHLIVQKAHDNYKKTMQKNWDKHIIL